MRSGNGATVAYLGNSLYLVSVHLNNTFSDVAAEEPHLVILSWRISQVSCFLPHFLSVTNVSPEIAENSGAGYAQSAAR